MIEIKFRGIEIFQDYLKNAPREVRESLEKWVEEMSERAYQIARERVPVRTGYLRSTIYKTKAPFLGRYTFILGAYADYAGFVEFGTRKMRARPYLRPAIDEVRKIALERLKAITEEKLKVR
ncbi:MAG: HK97 gp10 family phage protein [Nitrososphaerales archaeon]